MDGSPRCGGETCEKPRTKTVWGDVRTAVLRPVGLAFVSGPYYRGGGGQVPRGVCHARASSRGEKQRERTIVRAGAGARQSRPSSFRGALGRSLVPMVATGERRWRQHVV